MSFYVCGYSSHHEKSEDLLFLPSFEVKAPLNLVKPHNLAMFLEPGGKYRTLTN